MALSRRGELIYAFSGGRWRRRHAAPRMRGYACEDRTDGWLVCDRWRLACVCSCACLVRAVHACLCVRAYPASSSATSFQRRYGQLRGRLAGASEVIAAQRPRGWSADCAAVGSPVVRSIQVARPVAAAASPADEQLPLPWAELAVAGPPRPPRRSDLYWDEAAPTWPGRGAAVVTHER